MLRRIRRLPSHTTPIRGEHVMERNPWEKTFYHRVIQAKIGEALREQYDKDYASQPLPHGLLTLLMQLNEQQTDGQQTGERQSSAGDDSDSNKTKYSAD
jgi:hypothetical protein